MLRTGRDSMVTLLGLYTRERVMVFLGHRSDGGKTGGLHSVKITVASWGGGGRKHTAAIISEQTHL